jgi:hypothetical protein
VSFSGSPNVSVAEKQEKELATCNAQRSTFNFNSNTNATLSFALCLLHFVQQLRGQCAEDNVRRDNVGGTMCGPL